MLRNNNKNSIPRVTPRVMITRAPGAIIYSGARSYDKVTPRAIPKARHTSRSHRRPAGETTDDHCATMSAPFRSHFYGVFYLRDAIYPFYRSGSLFLVGFAGELRARMDPSTSRGRWAAMNNSRTDLLWKAFYTELVINSIMTSF